MGYLIAPGIENGQDGIARGILTVTRQANIVSVTGPEPDGYPILVLHVTQARQ